MTQQEAEHIVWKALVRCTKIVYDRLSDEEKARIDAQVEDAPQERDAA